MPEVVQFPPSAELPERTRRFLNWTREIGISHKPNMAGFVVLAWDEKGSLTICGDVRSDENPIPVYLLPAWISEHIRAEFVTGSEVRCILREIGVLAPKPSDEGA